mmetsp:Transcript_2859/g.4877  ORF Transcript_2859/g.4877 Transcript_2859/m.4877 type:complete len:83 (+) Transcript_2859:253-501(+)
MGAHNQRDALFSQPKSNIESINKVQEARSAKDALANSYRSNMDVSERTEQYMAQATNEKHFRSVTPLAQPQSSQLEPGSKVK